MKDVANIGYIDVVRVYYAVFMAWGDECNIHKTQHQWQNKYETDCLIRYDSEGKACIERN